MVRREFVKDSRMMVGGGLLLIDALGAYPADSLKVDYIREKIPAFEIPPYRGEEKYFQMTRKGGDSKRVKEWAAYLVASPSGESQFKSPTFRRGEVQRCRIDGSLLRPRS